MVRRHVMRDNIDREGAFRRVFAVATGSAAVGVLPVLLVGALFVFIGEEMVLRQSQLGLGVALFFGAAAAASLLAGWLVGLFGWKRILLGGLLLSLAAVTGLSGARSWGLMLGMLAVSGAANGIVLVASNVLIAERIAGARQGLAFGAKQAAIPAASLLAGVSVTLATIGVDWRVLTLAAAPFAVGTAAALWTIPGRGLRFALPLASRPTVRSRTTSLAGLSAAAALASAGATSLPAFLVVTTVSRGMDPVQAGVLQVIGSLLGVATRLALGEAADRYGKIVEVGPPLTLILGAMGFAVIAIADSFPVLIVGTSAAFVGGWGWTGLLWLSVASNNREAVAGAMGVVQAGMLAGGFAGPLAFGVIAESISGSYAWLGLTAAAAVAAALLVVEARRVALPRAM